MTQVYKPGIGNETVLQVDATAGNEAILLPSGFATGRKYWIRRVDSTANTVTVTVPTGQTLDGTVDGTFTVPANVEGWLTQRDPGLWESYGLRITSDAALAAGLALKIDTAAAGTRLGTTTIDGSGDPVINYESLVGIAGASSPSGLPEGQAYYRSAGAHPGEGAVMVPTETGALMVVKPVAGGDGVLTTLTADLTDAIALQVPRTMLGAASGVAQLGVDGKVVAGQMPAVSPPVGDVVTTVDGQTGTVDLSSNYLATAHNTDTSAHSNALLAKGQAQSTHWRNGGYLFCRGGAASTTTPAAGVVVAGPMPDVDRACTIDRIGIEVTSGGSVGAVIRFGLYADDGTGYPGALIYDAGQFAATGTGAIGDTTDAVLAAISIARGSLLWFAMVVQGAPATAPTVRANSGPITGFVASAGTHYNRGGLYTHGGVSSGGLPGTFTATMTATGAGPLGFVKIVS